MDIGKEGKPGRIEPVEDPMQEPVAPSEPVPEREPAPSVPEREPARTGLLVRPGKEPV